MINGTILGLSKKQIRARFDEVPAVGDRTFTQKCMERMNRLKEAGKTIIFVSHDLETVRTRSAGAVGSITVFSENGASRAT